MNKLRIWVIVIAGAFLIGVLSANAVVEAVGGWKVSVADLQEQIDNTSVQVYEVSLTVPIGISDDSLKPFSLRCSEGDRMYVSNSPFSSSEAVTDPEGLGTIGDLSFLTAGGVSSRIVGVEGLAQGTLQLFEYEITITILCLSPSS